MLGRILKHEPSRPERTVQLFTEICVPFSRGQLSAPPEGLGLVRTDLLPRERRWTDPVSASYLLLDEHTCSISTNAPNALTKAEGDVLAADIEQVVAVAFPELAFDPKATMGDDVLFRAWMTGKVASPQRWGVSVYMFPEWGDASGSHVSLTLPRSNRQ
jgi:hypothetical protein